MTLNVTMFAGTPPQTGTATLVVTLNDLNDHAPDFLPDMRPGLVGASTTAGQEVLRFTAMDLDSAENGPPFTFTYACNDVQCQDFDFQFLPGQCLSKCLRFCLIKV